MSEGVRLNAYFERIGFAGSIAPTLETLQSLHALQPAAIPFENLSSLLGLPVPLDQASLNQKLLSEKRGGYCFEQNLTLLRVLRELGYEARGHLAKVMLGRRERGDGPSDHIMLSVDIGGLAYLADVGFGGLLLTEPLRLKADVEQVTPHGSYRLTGENPAIRLETRRDDDWWPVYEFSLDPVEDATYEARNRELNADPEWFLRQNLLVERVTPAARLSLFNTRLTTTSAEGRAHRTLGTVGELRDALVTTFGISLPDIDGLDLALARLVTRDSIGA